MKSSLRLISFILGLLFIVSLCGISACATNQVSSPTQPEETVQHGNEVSSTYRGTTLSNKNTDAAALAEKAKVYNELWREWHLPGLKADKYALANAIESYQNIFLSDGRKVVEVFPELAGNPDNTEVQTAWLNFLEKWTFDSYGYAHVEDGTGIYLKLLFWLEISPNFYRGDATTGEFNPQDLEFLPISAESDASTAP